MFLKAICLPFLGFVVYAQQNPLFNPPGLHRLGNKLILPPAAARERSQATPVLRPKRTEPNPAPRPSEIFTRRTT